MRLGVIVFALSLVPVGMGVSAVPLAHAKVTTTKVALPARPSMQLPFACGKKARMSTGPTHSRARAKLLDMNEPPLRGEPVLASISGTVIRSEFDKGYGNIIVIKNSSRYYSVYAHLLNRKVSKGQKIGQHRLIGQLGNTGKGAHGVNHLHYEQHYDYDGDGFDYSNEWVYPVFNGVEYRLSEGSQPWAKTVTSKNAEAGYTTSGSRKGSYANCATGTVKVRAVAYCVGGENGRTIYGPWTSRNNRSYAWCPPATPTAVGYSYNATD